MKKYDTIVYILRAQPLHNAHLTTIRRAATLATNVHIIIGSSHQPRTIKNPFTETERHVMISNAIADEKMDANFKISFADDYPYNDQKWISQIQQIVSDTDNVAIIGHKKDVSSFYLDAFPQWTFVNQKLVEPLNATDIRTLYFRSAANMHYLSGVIPDSTYMFLYNFAKTQEYRDILTVRA